MKNGNAWAHISALSSAENIAFTRKAFRYTKLLINIVSINTTIWRSWQCYFSTRKWVNNNDSNELIFSVVVRKLYLFSASSTSGIIFLPHLVCSCGLWLWLVDLYSRLSRYSLREIGFLYLLLLFTYLE